MNNTAQVSGILRGILTQPTDGVVGLLDDLLIVCLEHGLQFEWLNSRCRFRAVGGNWEELTDLTLGKSVVRALLARVASLCKEQTPSPVSPYGGEGELSLGDTILHVSFVNTVAAQRLELTAPATSQISQNSEVSDAYRKLARRYEGAATRPAVK